MCHDLVYLADPDTRIKIFLREKVWIMLNHGVVSLTLAISYLLAIVSRRTSTE